MSQDQSTDLSGVADSVSKLNDEELLAKFKLPFRRDEYDAVVDSEGTVIVQGAVLNEFEAELICRAVNWFDGAVSVSDPEEVASVRYLNGVPMVTEEDMAGSPPPIDVPWPVNQEAVQAPEPWYVALFQSWRPSGQPKPMQWSKPFQRNDFPANTIDRTDLIAVAKLVTTMQCGGHKPTADKIIVFSLTGKDQVANWSKEDAG